MGAREFGSERPATATEVAANSPLSLGGRLVAAHQAAFRVWAPKRTRVEVSLQPDAKSPPQIIAPLKAAPDGYFVGTIAGPAAGWRYGFRLDDGDRLFPDPASRFQPDGPDGLSQLVDSQAFRWSDASWPGVTNHGQVIYEMHIGTFTPEGTWQAALAHLPRLAELGITLLEVMPVADFPGRFGWGYDGVNMFAPTRLYGQPDDFRAFVDCAHALGLGVILDVVYNHFGNVFNFLGQFSDHYKSTHRDTDWGDALNFDGNHAGPVREFFEANVRYWIADFHLDGFRFDATHAMHDLSEQHVLAMLTAAARQAAGSRGVYFAAENEAQDVRALGDLEVGGQGMHAMWNDDFHHAARVCLTGQSPAYYSDFRGTAQELISAVRHGFLYQGQHSQWQKKPRGTPTAGLNGTHFVTFLQNHDQIANSGTGARLPALTSPGRLRAMTALWLLAPQTPLFFQGQEFGATSPFLFFADPPGDAPASVALGRGRYLSQFPHLASPEAQRCLPLPHDLAVFERCKLNWQEWEANLPSVRLHRDLLQMRKTDAVFRQHDMRRIEGTALGPRCLALRYYSDGADRLLLANFDVDLQLSPCPEPLLAPPAGQQWEQFWSSESLEYGGAGVCEAQEETGWFIPAAATVLLRSVPIQVPGL